MTPPDIPPAVPRTSPTITIIGPTTTAGPHPTKAKAILTRIEEIAGHNFAQWCAEAGVTYPPQAVLMRAFKKERAFEIWAGDSGDHLERIATLPICAADFAPGPKLREGDGKTPEGVYHPEPLYWSRYDFMWMKLLPEAIDDYGASGDGSAFRLCVEYPTRQDRDRAAGIGNKNPGSAICLHGNCVSAGCLSFTNRDFVAVFAFAMHHRKAKYGALQLHIFPFRFEDHPDLAAEAARAAASGDAQRLGAAAITAEWEALRTLDERFRAQPSL